MSRGIVYFGPCCIVVIFVGDSGDDKEFDRDSPAKRCCIICSNFSTYRSLRSLACKIWRSRVDNWGIKDKSMELTASYNAANVSGKGDLKYSSRASNRSGYQVINNLKGDVARDNYLVYMKKRMSSADCHCFNHRPPIRHQVSSRRKEHFGQCTKPFGRGILLCIYKILYIDQRWPLSPIYFPLVFSILFLRAIRRIFPICFRRVFV